MNSTFSNPAQVERGPSTPQRTTNITVTPMPFSTAAAVSPEWKLDGTSVNFVVDGQVVYSVDAEQVFPIGPETVEVLELMRSTPYFTADVIVHLVAFLVEHDMDVQEAIDTAYFAKKLA